MPALSTSALNRHACNYVFAPEEIHGTIETFYDELQPQLEEAISELLSHHLEWKVHSCLEVKMRKSETFFFLNILFY